MNAITETEVLLPRHFDFPWMLGFLQARALSSLEHVDDLSYVRATRVDGHPVSLAIRAHTDRGRKPSLLARAAGHIAPDRLHQLVTRLFDLDARLAGFLRVAADDPTLARLVAANPSIRLPVYLDPFEALLRAILGQQVSVSAARGLGAKLVQQLGEPAPDLDGKTLFSFPRPEVVAATPIATLRGIGLTGARAATVCRAANAVASGELDFDALRADPNNAARILAALPGLGPWTAAYVCMRGLGHRDAFLASDLGVRKAVARACSVDTPPRLKEILAMAEAWRPWRAYATLHLWTSLSAPAATGNPD